MRFLFRRLGLWPCLLCFVLLIGCGAQDTPLAPPNGEVRLLAGEQTIEPLLINWVFNKRRDGSFKDGTRLTAEEMLALLPQDCPITPEPTPQVEGALYHAPFYSLYRTDSSEPCYRSADFTPPEEPGRYLLCVELAWGDESAYEGYQVLFAFSK